MLEAGAPIPPITKKVKKEARKIITAHTIKRQLRTFLTGLAKSQDTPLARLREHPIFDLNALANTVAMLTGLSPRLCIRRQG